MEKIKQLMKYDREIIEAFFISLVSGYVLSAIVRKTYMSITNMEMYKESNFISVIVMLILFAAVTGFIYYLKDSVARIFMFILVYIYAILCGYEGYGIRWADETNNAMGNATFNALLCFIVVITFLYIKDDIFDLFNSIKINKRTTYILVAIVGALLIAFIGTVTVLRYVTYSNSTFDFGIFAQMYESMIQRGTLETTVERSRLLSHFGVHFSPIIYITYPIYVLFPSPITVQMIQAIMLGLPILPIVLLCRKYNLSNWITVAVSLLYALYPATAGGTFYDMHENCFLVFGLLMVIWAIEKKSNIWTIVFLIFTYAIKEDASIYLLVFGTYLLFSRKDKMRGFIIMICSAIYFVVAVKIVNSYGLGVLSSHFSNLYTDPTGGMIEIVKTILTNPAYILGEMVTNYNKAGMDKVEYVVYMMVPVAAVLFTVKKKYSRYILLAPFVVLNLFTTYLYQHMVTFHYNYGIIALFVYLMIMNLSEMKHKNAKIKISICVICASIMFAGVIFPRLIHYVQKKENMQNVIETIDQALELIPEGASVCTSGYFMPHLSDYMELYDQNHLTQYKVTDYLVVDERYSSEAEKFNSVLATGQYESVYESEGIIQIYKKIQ